MIDTPVLVKVTGTDENGEQITLETRGYLTDANEKWYIRYDEVQPDSYIMIQTLIECQNGRVMIVRAGSVVTTIVYEENETFISNYEMPLGQFMLRVYSTQVHVDRQENEGHIHLAYQISLSSNLSPSEETAMRWLDIRFRPCGA